MIAQSAAPADPPTSAVPHAQAAVSVRALSRSYPVPGGERLVLDRVDLEVGRGRFVCVVGPSGAGKTTLLRCVSGLLRPTAGEVLVDGTAVVRPPEQLAVVFQDYSRSLMPWMSVRSNVMLPLRSRPMAKAERVSRSREALERWGWPTAASSTPGSSRAVCSSGRPSPAPWPAVRRPW
jgi:NitT/TauT family transport system ATP-binding protein